MRILLFLLLTSICFAKDTGVNDIEQTKIDVEILDDIEKQILAKQSKKKLDIAENKDIEDQNYLDSVFQEIVENEKSLNISEDEVFDDSFFTP